MQTFDPRVPAIVLKGVLCGADGSVWSLVEEQDEERIEQLDPSRATIEEGADPLQVAAYEIMLLCPN